MATAAAAATGNQLDAPLNYRVRGVVHQLPIDALGVKSRREAVGASVEIDEIWHRTAELAPHLKPLHIGGVAKLDRVVVQHRIRALDQALLGVIAYLFVEDRLVARYGPDSSRPHVVHQLLAVVHITGAAALLAPKLGWI